MNPSLVWLYGLQQFGIKPGLENTRRLLKALQLPGPRQRLLHVAGTNGKGSTCAFIESILRHVGERTGLFTSPHLVSFCERIRCGADLIPMQEVVQGIEALRDLVSGWEPHPTFFELTLMLALDWMDRQGAEVIALETGMGGRLDATNALTPVVSVITPIDMDHQRWLGSTLAEIAGEKAGIIKPGVPVVSAPQKPEVGRILRDAADRSGASITFINEPWEGKLPLPGEHQRWNAALAVAAIGAAGFRLSDSTLAEGLARTGWPARFQQPAGTRMVIDGAHNPHGMDSAVKTWREVFADEKATVIFGSVEEKDYRSSLSILGPMAARIFFVTFSSPRALSAEALLANAPPGLEATAFPSVSAAMAAAERLPERVFVCGSLYYCGEVLSLISAVPFEPSSQ